jgi:phenylacetate-CoA ligase
MKLLRTIRGSFLKPLWYRYNGQNYFALLPELEEFHRMPLERMREERFFRLRKVIHAAYADVPFYRREWDTIGLKPSDIQSLEDIKKIPILTKQKLREQAEEFLSAKSGEKALITSGTGGTTDSPITIKYDRKRLCYKLAEMDFYRRWWDWDFEDKVAYLWGAPQDIPNIDTFKYKVLNFLVGRNLYLFASLLNEEIMADYVERLNRFRPDILQGYSNPVSALARFILQRDLNVVLHSLAWATPDIVVARDALLSD